MGVPVCGNGGSCMWEWGCLYDRMGVPVRGGVCRDVCSGHCMHYLRGEKVH
uniref:Uncharacterized protein n=1 Tax=Anguilla anguilla TaxID=7936 RepID=A0A0E9SKB3_ANGAN